MRVHIHHTPMVAVRRNPAGERWCFGCRQHLTHEAVLWAEATPGYYEPHWALECSRCGKDRTRFPGRGS